MTIDKVKEELKNHIGKKASITHNLGRNKYETYSVIIKELYDFVFLVEDVESYNKSFSYTDIITKTIKIKYWQINYKWYNIIVENTLKGETYENNISKST